MYSPRLLEHFQDPRFAGELPDANVCVQRENPACGDMLLLRLRIEKETIVEARFQAKGCVAAMGCAAALTAMLQHQTLSLARAIRREQILDQVGGLPAESMHASHLAFEVLQQALRQAATVPA